MTDMQLLGTDVHNSVHSIARTPPVQPDINDTIGTDANTKVELEISLGAWYRFR
jgi:hypothetical protein